MCFVVSRNRITGYRLDVLRATKGGVVKKNFLSYILKKKSLYSTYSSFLVISVCNQGETLCSPCISLWVLENYTL